MVADTLTALSIWAWGLTVLIITAMVLRP